MPGTLIPRGNVQNTVEFATTLTPAAVAANTTAEQAFTIQGLLPGDYVNCNFSGIQTAGIFIGSVRVSSANVVAIGFGNCTGGSLTPQAGSYGFVMGRPETLPLPTNAV